MFTTIKQNQPTEIHFNTSPEYDYRCFVDQYAMKLNLSEMDYKDYLRVKEFLLYKLGGQAVCVHGFQPQELILVFKPEQDIEFFLKVAELEEIVNRVIGQLEPILLSIKKSVLDDDEPTDSEHDLDLVVDGEIIPYVLDISLTNIR